MTDQRKQINAIVLSVLMISSMVAGVATLGGPAAADDTRESAIETTNTEVNEINNLSDNEEASIESDENNQTNNDSQGEQEEETSEITENEPESDEEAAENISSGVQTEGIASAQQEIIVEDIDDLQEVQNNLNADIILRNDIDASETENWNSGAGFEPIGSNFNSPFTGTFDGRGHVIENLTINRPDESRVGLFGHAEDTTIENVRLENASITGQSRTGGIAGTIAESPSENSFVKNTSVEGEIEGTRGPYTGGIVGFATGGGSGQTAYGPVLDEENRFSGEIRGDQYVGGLLGRSNFGTEMGVGYVEDATIEGNQDVGGLVGFSSFNPSSFDEMYVSATVDSAQSDSAGAVVGLVGDDGSGNDGVDQFPAVYWDEDVENREYVGSFVSGAEPEADRKEPVGLSTDEMTGEDARDNMAEYDFENRWLIRTNPEDYPTFFWEAQTPDAPEASIDASQTTLEVDETIFVDAGGSDGDINTYEWEFDDGTSETGESVEHSYDAPGSYTIAVGVTGPTGIDMATIDVLVSDDDTSAFTVNPTTPEVGEGVEFASPENERHEWDFDDGETAIGASPTHTFTRPGVYNVTMITDDENVTRTIGVEEGPIDISNVESTFTDDAFVIEAFDIETDFRINVSSERDVENVVIEIQDEKYEATQVGDETWEAKVDLSSIDADTVINVTATDDLGRQDVEDRSIRYGATPEWLTWMLDNARNVKDLDGREVEAGVEIVLFDFDRGVDVLSGVFPWDRDFGALTEIEASVFITAPQGLVEVSLNGEGEVVVKGVEVDVDGGGTGTVNADFELESAEAELSGGVSAPVWQAGFDPRYVPPQQVQVRATGDVNTGAEFEGTDSGMNFDQGSIEPLVGLEADTTFGVSGGEVKAGVDGSTGGSAGFGIQDPYLRNIGIPVESNIFGKVDVTVYQSEFTFVIIDDEIELHEAGPEAMTADGITTVQHHSDWEVTDKHGDNPESADSITGLGTASSTTSGADVERLSERGLEDTHPAIAETEGEIVAMWSRQDESKDVVEGRDLTIRVKDGEWADTEWVTDDTRHDSHPVLEPQTDGDSLLAVWERVDTELSESGTPDDVFENTEIALATASDPATWTDPMLLSEEIIGDSVLTDQPAVAASGDQWLVAWQRNEANNPEQVNRTHVDYALLSPSDSPSDSPVDVDETGTIENATNPAVASEGDNSFALAYFAPTEDHRTGNITRSVVDAAGDVTTAEQYEVEGFGDVTVAEDRLVWSERVGDDEHIRDTGGEAEPDTLQLDGGISNIDDIDIQMSDDRSILTYRGTPDDSLTRDIIYRIEEDGDWTADRRVAGGDDDAAVWHAATELEGTKFNTVYAKQPTETDGVNDIFVKEGTFSPAYTVSADADDDASVGDKITIEYSVQNVGLEASEEVTVELASDAEVVDSTTVGPLATNETVEDTFETTVGESGSFTIDLAGASTSPITTTNTESGSLDEQEPWLPTSDNIIVAEPELGVGIVSTTVNESGDFAKINVSNAGNATATDIPVGVTSGSTWLANTTIERVEANDTGVATVEIDRTQLVRDSPETVVIDPDDELPEDWISDLGAQRNIWLLQPDLAVERPISYENRSGVAVADVGLSNTGDLDAIATVSIVGHEGTVIGEETISIDADQNSTVHERALVELSEQPAEGESLDIFVDSVVQDGTPSTTGISDDFGPVVETDLPAPSSEAFFEIAATSISDEITAGDTMEVDSSIENTGNLAETQTVELLVAERVVDMISVELGPSETAQVTLTHDTTESDIGTDVPVTVQTVDMDTTSAIEIAGSSSDDSGNGGTGGGLGGSTSGGATTQATTTPSASASTIITDDLPEAPGTTVTLAPTDLESITFKNDTAGGSVSVDQFDELPIEAPDIGDDRPFFASFGIDVPDELADQPATIEFVVSEDMVTNHEVGAEDLAVLYAPSGANEYTALNTTVVDTNDKVTIDADTPGFSTFVVTAIEGSEEGEPAESVDDDSDEALDDEPSEPADDDADETHDDDPADMTAEPTETSDEIPGFGTLVALVALVAAALLATRRTD